MTRRSITEYAEAVRGRYFQGSKEANTEMLNELDEASPAYIITSTNSANGLAQDFLPFVKFTISPGSQFHLRLIHRLRAFSSLFYRSPGGGLGVAQKVLAPTATLTVSELETVGHSQHLLSFGIVKAAPLHHAFDLLLLP